MRQASIGPRRKSASQESPIDIGVVCFVDDVIPGTEERTANGQRLPDGGVIGGSQDARIRARRALGEDGCSQRKRENDRAD